MITFFATPKPFRGHIGLIQRNAIQSWRQLHPSCQILLFGAEEGAAKAARECGAQHVPAVARNQYGTPLLPDLFAQAKALAAHPTLCFINCDIILVGNFLSALDTVRETGRPFLMVGQCWNIDLNEPLPFDDPGWARHLQALIDAQGALRGHRAIDYFAFSRNLYEGIPAFAIGRIAFDNWLIWKAIATKATVADATESLTAVHQNHDYAHVPGGKAWSYEGEEAQENLRMAGPLAADFGIADATHQMSPAGLKVNWPRYTRLFKRWRRRHGVRRSMVDQLLGLRQRKPL